jgi:integrase/recombinase XerD
MPRRTTHRRRFLTQVGDPSDPDGLFISMQQYLAYLGVKGHTPTGIHNVERYIRSFIRWCEPRALVRPLQITKVDVESYQRDLFRRRKDNGEPLSVFSQRSALIPLRGFFRWLAREGRVPRDPAVDIELPRVRQVLPSHVLTASEAERVLRQPDTRRPVGLRDKAILEVLYSTGLRRMEVANLHVADIDNERGLIFVRKGKWGKDRWIPISNRAIRWVQRYLSEVRPSQVTAPDDGTLFLTRNGVPFNECWLSTTISNHVRNARLGKFGSCHLFRHTMATLMLENGADIRYIQSMLGHADLKSTQIYAHVSVEKLRAVHSATHPGCSSRDGLPEPVPGAEHLHRHRSLKQYLRGVIEELPETATLEDLLRRLLPYR